MMSRSHPSSRTTAAVRQEIRSSTDSLKVLAARYGINPKTVAKWKKREDIGDRPSGRPCGIGKLTAEEENIIIRFREHTLLPLDDCLYALQAQIPYLRRSSLHRCLQRHGVSNLTETMEGEEQALRRAAYPLGTLHLERSLVHIGDETHFLFIVIDQASKFVIVRRGSDGGPAEAARLLAALALDLPFSIRQVVTPIAEPFTVSGRATGPFASACEQAGIEQRLTPTSHPWTRGRGSRMGQMVEDSISLDSEDYLVQIQKKFVHAYNFRRRLKSLGGRTPYQFICDTWKRDPAIFLRDPHHELSGLETVPDWSRK